VWFRKKGRLFLYIKKTHFGYENLFKRKKGKRQNVFQVTADHYEFSTYLNLKTVVVSTSN